MELAACGQLNCCVGMINSLRMGGIFITGKYPQIDRWWSKLENCTAHFILTFVALEKWCDKVCHQSGSLLAHWCREMFAVGTLHARADQSPYVASELIGARIWRRISRQIKINSSLPTADKATAANQQSEMTFRELWRGTECARNLKQPNVK